MAGARARDRMARWSTLVRFVGELSESHPQAGSMRDAVDVLLDRLGGERGPAVVLTALLLALGERADLECTREMAIVRVALEPEDLPRLPPHARPLTWCGRLYLFLDARRARSPLGFLPAAVHDAVAARHRSGPALRRLPAWT